MKVGFLGGSEVKNLPANTGNTSSIPELARSPGEMATLSSILACGILRTEEADRVQSMESQKSWSQLSD